MTVRKALVLAVVFLLLSGTAFAQKRAEKGSATFSATEFFIGQCEGFEILSDFVALMKWTDVSDKSGELKLETLQLRASDTLYYNSLKPEKPIIGGPIETQNNRTDYRAGTLAITGLVFRVRVPGYGLIFGETGRTLLTCDPSFQYCTMVSSTGHNMYEDKDVAALCNYLK